MSEAGGSTIKQEQAQITPVALEGGFKADAGKARLDLFPVPALRRMLLDAIPTDYTAEQASEAVQVVNGLCNFWDVDAAQSPEDSIAYTIKHASRLMEVSEAISPAAVIMQVGELYALGAKKYADRNWEKGMDWGRCFAAALRHLLKFFGGETYDQIDGQHHLTSVLWCALALEHYNTDLARYGRFDTRQQTVVATNVGQK